MSIIKPSQHTTTKQLFEVLDMMTKELEDAQISNMRGGGSHLNDLDTTKLCFSNVLWELTKSIKEKDGQEIKLPKPMSERLNLILTLLRIQLRLEKGLN